MPSSWLDRADRVQRANVRALGDPISYTPAGGSEITTTPEGSELRGVFQAEGALVTLETGMLQRTNVPQVGVRLADFDPPASVGGLITARGTTYRIDDINPDGEGGAVLGLSRL